MENKCCTKSLKVEFDSNKLILSPKVNMNKGPNLLSDR